MENRDSVVSYINRTLDIAAFEDYCPNGLQVAGRQEIRHIVSGVTASQRFLDAAIDAGADAVLVHHGYFWRGESQVLTGMKLARIKRLLEADLSLMAYHLPLDVHPELGNNAQLAKVLSLIVDERVSAGGTPGLFFVGHLAEPVSCAQFSAKVSAALGRTATVVGHHNRPVKRVGWCTGGAQRFIGQAIDLGLDAYISGEISEQTAHEARESGVLFVAAGHHATERYGVQALGAQISSNLQVTHQFIDVDNPA